MNFNFLPPNSKLHEDNSYLHAWGLPWNIGHMLRAKWTVRWLGDSFSSGSLRFSSGWLYVRFMVDEVTLGRDFLRIFLVFLLLIMNPSSVLTHPSPPPEMWDRTEQAPHYHFLGLQVEGFVPDPGLCWLQCKYIHPLLWESHETTDAFKFVMCIIFYSAQPKVSVIRKLVPICWSVCPIGFSTGTHPT
jgi:hypothetical protein